MSKRKHHKATSNNADNPCKNMCALRVAEFLRVDHTVRYLHTINDLVRAARKKYTVRSRMSAVRGGTVGAVRKEVANLTAKYYIVRVPGHVILLDNEGNTLVDTDPRKKDKRRVTHLYGVFDPVEFDLRVDKWKPIAIQKVFSLEDGLAQ